MNLTDAITRVVADTREQDPDRNITDDAILAEIRGFDHAEITSWVEAEVIEPGELETAYRMVLDASADEVTRALR